MTKWSSADTYVVIIIEGDKWLKRSIHCFVGFAFGVLVSGSQYSLIPFASIMGFLGGWMPDLDLRMGHRKTLHNIFTAFFFSIMLYMSLLILNNELKVGIKQTAIFYIVFSFFGGYILHLLGDMITPRGVYLLYPIVNYRFRVASLKSSSTITNVLGFLFGSLLLLLWFIGYYHTIEQVILNR